MAKTTGKQPTKKSVPQVKPFTIKDADLDDIEEFNRLKTENRLTQGGAFSLLINRGDDKVNAERIQELQAQLEEVNRVNQDYQQKEAALAATMDDQDKRIKELQEKLALYEQEVEKLRSEVQDLNDNPRIEYKEKDLEGLQFICEPSEEVFKMARKARTFLRKDGVIKGSDDEYPSELFNKSVKYYLINKYDHLFE